MKKHIIFMLALGLAACSGGGGGGGGLPQPPPAAPIEDNFGAGFGAAFRANPNSEPRDPMAADIIPVDVTKDPVLLP